jgi:hypothetical protein
MPCRAKGVAQGAAFGVRADDTDRKRHAAQRPDVGRGVASPSRQLLLLPEAEDQDGRLSTDAFGMAVDEAIEDEVPGHHDAAALETRDQREEALALDWEGHCGGL